MRAWPVYDTDREAKRLNDTDPEIRAGLTSLFGAKLYATDSGRLDRVALANIIFSDPDALQAVNALVHPAVKRDIARFVSEEQEKLTPYVGIECAILYEAGLDSLMTAVLSVEASDEVRIARVMARQGISREQVLDRFRAQTPWQETASKADYNLINEPPNLILPQLDKIISDFTARR